MNVDIIVIYVCIDECLFIFIFVFMSYKDYSLGFRKEIRRNQLDLLFQKKRQLLLQSSQVEKMQQQHIPIENQTKNELDYLKTMANMSKSENGIINLQKSQIQKQLYQYLKPQYLERDQQYYSTYILSNLYYFSTPVHQNLLNSVNSLLQQNIHVRVLENLCHLLQNIMSDHASVKQTLVKDYNFINTIIRLWNFPENPSIRYITCLVSLMFKILINNQPNPLFLKLRSYLFRVIKIEFKPQLSQMLKKAFLSIYTITEMYPKETADMIVHGQIIQKFLQCLAHFRSKRFAYIIIDMLYCIMTVSYQQFNEISSNVFFFLFQNNFELKQKSLLSSRDLKIHTYKLIYLALQKQKLTVKDIINRSYFKNMKDDYENSDDAQLLSSLTYIFIHIYLNCSESGLKLQIEYYVERIKYICRNNYEVMGHIHFAQQFFEIKKDKT